MFKLKTIIYNDDYLKKEDITRIVKRAKAVIINSKDENSDHPKLFRLAIGINN